MKGLRLVDGTNPRSLEPGQYCLTDGKWWAVTPNGGPAACLDDHAVTEHEDGTITVSPSILADEDVVGPGRAWHGWLERGEWRAS